MEPLLPKELFSEALMMRLAVYESPQKAKTGIVRFQKRAAYGQIFEYSSDFDEKGVLYWIGTKRGTARWRNPCLVNSGISVTASSTEKGDPINLVGRKPTELWTMDVPSSWFCVDLGSTRSLLLTHYTLRHGGNSKKDSLRNWVLQASDDGINWKVLSRHRDEKDLDSNFATCSWPVMSSSVPFRFFRILQTGHNSSNHNFLSLSGIELYGELYDNSEQEWIAVK
jgi:E3 ubiquitin-protein ligase HECTD1